MVSCLNKVHDTLRDAPPEIRKMLQKPEAKIINCEELKRRRKEWEGRPIVYVLREGDAVFYVGQTANGYRRLYKGHCEAHIGNSEGVVRLLMYYLPETKR